MMNSWRITDKNVRNNAMEVLIDVPLDGKWIVTIGDKKEHRSIRQLRLYWLLINTIVKSGRGGRHESSKELLDLKLKFSYAFPLLVADDSRVAESWMMWHKSNPSAEDASWWVKQNIHIGQLSVDQMTEVLESIYFEYGSNIDLPDPSMYQYELSETDHA